MRIYVASSWRNRYQPEVVAALRQEGWTVYDFRHPAPDDEGFHWSEIDPDWMAWTAQEFRQALEHPFAQLGFAQDKLALQMADVTVLVLPCGNSSHLELGYAAGLGQRTVIYLPERTEPDLMYRLADVICLDLSELIDDLWAYKQLGNSPRMKNGA